MLRKTFTWPFHPLLFTSCYVLMQRDGDFPGFHPGYGCNVYHDFLWYPLIGQKRIREFRRTERGEVWNSYGRPQSPLQPAPRMVTGQA
jgi:hypothetical protein